ncbi:type II toxin-antitoxin system RelE/ParE family toxin [uncultured Rothia sp.]|uniref:type II toxin-antitoxin system RelE family toxin n=1 Tax=uncultured Rothia sp. TaxID=316088 RepID=UPI0034D96E80
MSDSSEDSSCVGSIQGAAGRRRVQGASRDYRILYTIDNGAVVVEVFRVGHRREVYRGL